MPFTMHTTKKLTRGAIIAMTAVALAGPALAAKGGNGNGNGRGNSANAQSAEKGNNGRGAIASELKGLNAAHANINGLMNANPDSQVGRIYAYQQAILGVAGAGADAENLWAEIQETWGAGIEDSYGLAVGDADSQIAFYDALIAGLGEGEALSQEDADAYVALLLEQARLAEMTEQEKATEFGDSEDEAFLLAMEEYAGYEGLQEEQQLLADETLFDLTGGEELSEEALNEFLRLLGLLE